MHHPHKTSVVFKVGLLFGLVLPLSSHAQISDDTLVRRMIQEGRFDDALSNLDASIKRSPRDAQLHLLRGAALSMSNRKAEALKAFAYMVDQQLDTATAYNNIAVILASRGLYEGARGALECALKANPNYVTARQNMGDVYANLSNLAYRQALHMDRSDPSLPTKLAHLTQMLGDSANQTQQPDTPQDGRYYAQPCTPEPLQVARQSFDAVPMTSINPTPVVPAQSPLIPEPQPASPPSQYKSSSDVPAGLPSFGNGVSRPSQPPAATPLPGHNSTKPPSTSPEAPVPAKLHQVTVSPEKLVTPGAALPVPMVAQAPGPALTWSRPSQLPRAAAAPAPLMAAAVSATATTTAAVQVPVEKSAPLTFSNPKRLGLTP
jgi:Tetratricopeptide repeat